MSTKRCLNAYERRQVLRRMTKRRKQLRTRHNRRAAEQSRHTHYEPRGEWH